eukprot:1188526-Prorocentrum_minimum.AAC.1
MCTRLRGTGSSRTSFRRNSGSSACSAAKRPGGWLANSEEPEVNLRARGVNSGASNSGAAGSKASPSSSSLEGG